MPLLLTVNMDSDCDLLLDQYLLEPGHSSPTRLSIYQIEAVLERCRLALALNNPDQAHTKLDEAQALVKQTERPYEPHIPTWDEWDPPEYVGIFKPGEIVGYHRRNGEIAELEETIRNLQNS